MGAAKNRAPGYGAFGVDTPLGSPIRLSVENFAAAEIELDDQAMSDLEGLDEHQRYVTGEFWAKPGKPYTVANLRDE